ncbi:MAG: tRNA (N(6)-L-threonylcarbamoyladenosine(37)-C(2))-methylthiotransferase MtaB [Lachnospiraceae bacterium]|nr:tRNA (N(6)-L-threonylcarbamoyladenosine(37)-C(2))-methylthiotransferase MtaB [Lachnospiraceae bacterium]
MRTIAFHNLGCKVNSYELDFMTQKCVELGYEIVEFEQKADIYIVNTCSVTNIADRKSRQMLHKAKKNNPDSIVVAVGCFVQANPEEVMKDEAIDIIVGNNKKKEIFEIIEEYLTKKEAESLDKDLSGSTITDVHNCEYEEMKVVSSFERSRAYVKIQDGCDRYCTYCIIPYVRGNIRSRKTEDVLAEIREIAIKGYKEIVITGIHISSYGKDFENENDPRVNLIKLLRDINEIEGIERIRIGSFEPMILSEDFVKDLSLINKLCPHFHISLQSGCDSVLKRMNRHYNANQYYEKVELLRKYFPGCAITTDVIVGFPGETEEEFEVTKDFLKKVKFFETHIFPYSRRKGTIADKMPGQLTAEEKKVRVKELLALDEKESFEFRKSKCNSENNIIVEEIKTIQNKEYYVGHTPEYVMVAIDKDNLNDDYIGKEIKVFLKCTLNEEILLGELI